MPSAHDVRCLFFRRLHRFSTTSSAKRVATSLRTAFARRRYNMIIVTRFSSVIESGTIDSRSSFEILQRKPARAHLSVRVFTTKSTILRENKAPVMGDLNIMGAIWTRTFDCAVWYKQQHDAYCIQLGFLQQPSGGMKPKHLSLKSKCLTNIVLSSTCKTRTDIFWLGYVRKYTQQDKPNETGVLSTGGGSAVR